jgi:hypothetical protein
MVDTLVSNGIILGAGCIPGLPAAALPTVPIDLALREAVEAPVERRDAVDDQQDRNHH